jgi:hypothetical protein
MKFAGLFAFQNFTAENYWNRAKRNGYSMAKESAGFRQETGALKFCKFQLLQPPLMKTCTPL